MNDVIRKIFCFWTGNNPITPNRLKGLKSMRDNIDVPIEFLDASDIEKKIMREEPLHPAYRYLSAVHKSDYLRCYFMHHFGGGYADIKPYSVDNNWSWCFDYINQNPEVEIVGQHEEVGGIAVPSLRTQENADAFVACGWMICRPKSKFTTEWYSRMLRKLDEKFCFLRLHPATDPYGGRGYPLKCAEILGRIYHQVQYETVRQRPKAISNLLKTGWQGFNVAYR